MHYAKFQINTSVIMLKNVIYCIFKHNFTLIFLRWIIIKYESNKKIITFF